MLPPAPKVAIVLGGRLGLVRGGGSEGRGFRLALRAAGLRGLRRERRSAADADPGNLLLGKPYSAPVVTTVPQAVGLWPKPNNPMT